MSSDDGSDDLAGAPPLHHDTDGGSSDDAIIVTDPTKDDVLLGRGRSHHEHPGNMRFTELISTNQEKYTEMSSPIDKKQLIHEIVDQIHERGRFLKRMEKNRWKVIDIEQVHRKVAHAIQYQRRRTTKSLESSSSNNNDNPSSSSNVESTSPFEASQYGGGYTSLPIAFETMQTTPVVPHHPSMNPHGTSNAFMKRQRSMSFPFGSTGSIRSDPFHLTPQYNINSDSLNNSSFFNQQQQPYPITNSHHPAASYNTWNSRTSTSVSPPKQRADRSLMLRPMRRQQYLNSISPMMTTPPATTLTSASAAAHHRAFPSAPMTVPLYPPPERIPDRIALQRSSTLPTSNRGSQNVAMPTTTQEQYQPMDWLSVHPETAATTATVPLTSPPRVSQRDDIGNLHPNPPDVSHTNNPFQEGPPRPLGVGQLHSINNDTEHGRSTTSIGSFDLDELDDGDGAGDDITW